MKPAPFAYARPETLADLLDRLAATGGAAKLIAGGQSLGPMLALRLVEPDLLIDVTGLPELRRAGIAEGALVLGACVTHADIEDGRVPDLTGGAMRRVAAAIAYRAVRNRGTIGGSLAHADPAADWVTALAALSAVIEIAARGGRRRVAAADFVTGALATVLEPGEVVAAIRVPPLPDGAAWGYVKHCAKIGEFAHAIGAVCLDPAAGRGRAVIGAIERAPLVMADARPLFGGRIGPDFAARFVPEVADAALREAGIADPADRHIHVTVLARAVAQAAGGTRPAYPEAA
ncbi:FAD binding domain-containing protein [Methylobacterium sp. JK268]